MKQGQEYKRGESREIYSVRIPNPSWFDGVYFIVQIGLIYIVVLPVLEKGATYARKFLRLSNSKNLQDNSNTLVTNNLDEKTLINPAEIISRYNKNELTFNQAKLLLSKSIVFNPEEIDTLLKKD